MKASHQAYGRARKRLLDAQAAAVGIVDEAAASQAASSVAAAHDALQAAAAEVQEDFDRAWDANRAAVGAADEELLGALRQLGAVEAEVGTAARRRYVAAGGIGLVFLLDDEQAQVNEVRSVVAAARAACVAAREAFKAGVTAEQLAG